MPHLFVNGTDMDKQIQYIHIHADINFKRETFGTVRQRVKMEELREKLEALLSEYFDYVESDITTNHEYNLKMNGG